MARDGRQLEHADDVVVYVAPTREAVHAAMLQVYEQAKQRVSSNDAEYVDADGEVRERVYRISFGEDRRDLTAKQRGFLHKAVFPQIAEQVTFPDGSRFEWRVWKEMFRGRFLGDRWESKAEPRWDREKGRYVIPKRKTPRKVRISTEDLSIKQYSEYIDLVIDTAVAEYGVRFVFIEREREEVKWKPKRRKGAGENRAAADPTPAAGHRPVPRPGAVPGLHADEHAACAGAI